MDPSRVYKGRQVEIKRSDGKFWGFQSSWSPFASFDSDVLFIPGRIHGAVISDVNQATASVTVEWFEKVIQPECGLLLATSLIPDNQYCSHGI